MLLRGAQQTSLGLSKPISTGRASYALNSSAAERSPRAARRRARVAAERHADGVRNHAGGVRNHAGGVRNIARQLLNETRQPFSAGPEYESDGRARQ
ncbi:hypothetical protein FG87_03705 [Nocardia vulneris]|uniref:Uncharacterized protein n=1 Tax=Nocardia vulneris TaxID=1141657 RepID=A0ABR4ZM54_9NOCA|nr:hypothetical protein FG87_03705 [Nocardia vulneris]